MIQFHRHGFGQFDKNHLIGPSILPHFDILYIHQGQVELETDDRPCFQMKAGESILVYPQTRFEGEALSPLALASIQHFDFQREKTLSHALPSWHDKKGQTELFQNSKDTQIEKDVNRAIELSRFEGSQSSQETREALLFLILSQLRNTRVSHSTMTAEQQALEQSRSWALDNLKDSITVEKMAAKAELSSSHFRACFKKHFDESAGRFLLRNRIYRARELLRETRMPIKEISQETGYANVIPFHQAFHKHTGQTPAQYRKEYALNG
jgi:AraC-like DNA-binding protein